MPVISVVIPSYNHELYVASAIDSVLGQTHDDFELIIIDDGSTDGSREIISDYSDPRIKVIFQENQGAHAAINRGLNMSEGEYITILNSDDTFDKDRFEKCLDVFNVNNEIDLVSSWINVIDERGNNLGVKKAWHNMEPWVVPNKDKSFAQTDDYKLNALMSNFVSTTSNMIFKREVYEKIGGMRNLRFTHDWDYLLRVCEYFNPFNISEALINYRIHGSNTINTHRKWMLFEICWIMAANIDRFNKMLLPRVDEKNFIENIERMFESFNFQGNDHVARILYWQMSAMKQRGINNPEEIYLSNETIRNKIIEYVKDV